VKECVASFLTQTHTDFNCIVLDNCSTDGTLQWLQSLSDSRVKVIPSERPLTIEENWGRIKDVDKNEFITLIGHDDILYPEFLEVMDRLVTSYPEASLYHTHFNYMDENGNTIRPCKPMKQCLTGYEFLNAFLTGSIDSMGTGYVMRSKDYDELHGIPVKYPNLLFADFELWLSLMFKSHAIIAPEKCFAFRLYQGTTSTSQDKKLHQALELFVDYLVAREQDDAQAKSIIDESGAKFLLFCCKGFSNRLLRTPIQKRENLTVRDFIDHTKKLAARLSIEDKYKPEKVPSIRLAAVIDSNPLLRNLFLVFKKLYPKPILK
jgi:glycosyltransferase involved in cell wall biosynthesis